MLEFLLALTRQGHVIYHATPSHPPNPFPHSSIQQIHNINMKEDGSTHDDILHSIHLIYPIFHILHFFLNAISLSLSLVSDDLNNLNLQGSRVSPQASSAQHKPTCKAQTGSAPNSHPTC